MEAQQVIEKILADAKAEAEKITQQAQEKQADEQAKLDEQLVEYRKQTETLAEKAARDESSHLLAAARMQIAKEYLAEKRRILDDVFEQARERLRNLPDEEYCGLMKQLMLEAVETGEEEVIVDAQEDRIDASFIEQANSKLAKTGKGNLKLAPDKHNLGAGFLLRQGKIKTNVSVDVLLDQTRKDLEIELAKELFEN